MNFRFNDGQTQNKTETNFYASIDKILTGHIRGKQAGCHLLKLNFLMQ